jgi:regulator of protease activity HflC (stomatin/prohibitin superfamily)
MIERTIKRLISERKTLEKHMQETADQALMDWLLLAACAEYDTIELDAAVTGKEQRKQYKALRDQKRNVEKMLAALQDVQQIAGSPEGEKLRKKFEAEAEKYQA